MVAKHYIHIKGDISIDRTLASLNRMRNEIGGQLAKMLAFVWRTYKAKKERIAKIEADRKAKAKAAKGKKKGKARNHSF